MNRLVMTITKYKTTSKSKTDKKRRWFYAS